MAPLVRRVAHTSWSELRLLLQAAWEIIAASVALRFHIAAIQQTPPLNPTVSCTPSETQIAWAIEAVGRRTPGATCLVQALACRALLAKYGYDSELRIGVSPREAGRIQAHAWIERNGVVLLGGKRSDRDYVVMGTTGAAGSRPE